MAHEAGLDPYDAKNISRASGKNRTQPYIYPPLTLKVFSQHHGVDFPAAARIWLFLKIAMLGCLVLVWRRDSDLFTEYVGVIRSTNDLGDRYNPGSLAIVTNLFKNLGAGSWQILSILVYAAIVALILSITARTVWPERRSG